jgi:hypothetical protein
MDGETMIAYFNGPVYKWFTTMLLAPQSYAFKTQCGNRRDTPVPAKDSTWG